LPVKDKIFKFVLWVQKAQQVTPLIDGCTVNLQGTSKQVLPAHIACKGKQREQELYFIQFTQVQPANVAKKIWVANPN
jgi:hypothetical protein